MSLKVINNIECFDMKHNAPRTLEISSHHEEDTTNPWIELSLDNHIYKVRAIDIQRAVNNAVNS